MAAGRIYGDGRPSKISQAKVQAIGPWMKNGIMQQVYVRTRAGVPAEIAGAALGISRETFKNWMRRGAEHREAGKRSLYVDFLVEIETAFADAVQTGALTIRKAGITQWQAMAWWLERVVPNQFGRRLTTEITGASGGPIRIIWDTGPVPIDVTPERANGYDVQLIDTNGAGGSNGVD